MHVESCSAEKSNSKNWSCFAAWLSRPVGRAVAAVTATLLWGSAFPFVKVGYAVGGIRRTDTFAQILFAGYRFALAGLILCLLAAVVGHRPIPRTTVQARFAFQLSITQTLLQYLFFYIGIALSSGTSASIMAGTLTFFQLIIAHIRHADDRLSVRKILSAAAGFAAIVAYRIDSGSLTWNFGSGEICILAAMFFAAFGNDMNRDSPAFGWEPLPLTGFQMLSGGVVLTLIGAIGGDFRSITMSAELVGILLYLSLVSGSSFLLWNSLMTFNKAGSVSLYLFLVPVFGVLLSALIIGEPINHRVLPVLVVVTTSIIVAQWTGNKRPCAVIAKSQ